MNLEDPFHILTTRVQVAVHPSKSVDALFSIKEKLNNILLKYNENMQGVPLTYENISFQPDKQYARIIGEHPWLHVEITTDFTIFRPIAGQRLFGRVNKVSDSHVSLLVYSFFNATILDDKLKQECKYDLTNNLWHSSDRTIIVEEGSLVEFVVLGHKHAQGVFFLEAGLK